MLYRDSGLALDARMWVLQETFLKACLLVKDDPQLSSRTHGIRKLLLAERDQVQQEILWNMEEG